jgi:hypothetical protein
VSCERLAAERDLEPDDAIDALNCLPADQRAVLHAFLARHGTRYPELVRAPPGAQVRVEYLERSPTGILREAIARELRAAVSD